MQIFIQILGTNTLKKGKMFVLGYINVTFLALMYLIASVMDPHLWIFLISGGIFTLLYTNLIIMCKYSAIFIKKTIKKELLTQNEIYFLITSIVIFVTIGVVLTPKEETVMFPYISTMNNWEIFLASIIGYIFFLLLSSALMITALFSLEVARFFWIAPMVTVMWIHAFILSKYLYIFIRKIIKKEPLTQKEIIYLITSLVFFYTTGYITILMLSA